MRTAASSFPNPVAGALDGADRLPTAKVLARRAKQRRQMLGIIGASYVIDAAILLLYAHAGTIPATIGPAFGICGLGSVACFIALSEAGVNDRFKDHYFVVQQSMVSLAIMLAFACARARGRHPVSLHAVRGVQLQRAALDAAADRDRLDRDGIRPRGAVSADRQADLDAAPAPIWSASPPCWRSS